LAKQIKCWCSVREFDFQAVLASDTIKQLRIKTSKAEIDSGKLLLILQISVKDTFKYTFVVNLKIIFKREFHKNFQKISVLMLKPKYCMR